MPFAITNSEELVDQVQDLVEETRAAEMRIEDARMYDNDGLHKQAAESLRIAVQHLQRPLPPHEIIEACEAQAQEHEERAAA
jgi:hypothetical protein